MLRESAEEAPLIRRWMVGVVLVTALACAKNHQLTDTSSTILALASSRPNVATFISMLETSGVDTKLRGNDPITVLAPNNVALDGLGADRIRFLMSVEGSVELTKLVNAHVFPGALSAEDVARGKLPPNLEGKRIEASKASDGTPRVQGTGKILESMMGSNGYVHIIDTVLR